MAGSRRRRGTVAPLAPGVDELFVYARLSHNPDGTRTGVDRQLNDLYADAEARGVPREKVRVYAEDDRSASIFAKKPRPVFESLLRDIEAERPQLGAHFWKLDRGFRRGDDLERFLTAVNAAEVNWRSLNDAGVDTTVLDRDTSELLAKIFVWQAGKEVKNTSIRQQSKQRELAELGRHSGGGSPAFGHSLDWSSALPGEAALICQAARQLLAGASWGSVARRWNAAGVPTATQARGSLASHKAGRWTPHVVRVLFTSYRLAGAREWEGRLIVTGAIAPILDLETVERLRAKAALGADSQREHGSYPISGLCFCGECGHVLHAKGWNGKDGQHHLKFWCPKSAAADGCGRVSVSYEPLWSGIDYAARGALTQPELLAAARGDDTDYDQIRGSLAGIEERLKALAVARFASEPPMSDGEYHAARNALHAQQQPLQRKLAAVPLREVSELIGDEDPGDFWDEADEETKALLLRRLIKRIEIGRATKLGCRFDDSRISISWAL